MKHKTLIWLLSAEAVLCAAFCLLKGFFSGWFTTALAFPLEQAALGLRALALTGRVGNAAALTLYAAACLVPVWFLLRASSRRRLFPEDALLGLLSALLFAFVYMIANGVSLSPAFPADVTRAALGLCAWSALIGYVVLRLLRLYSQSGGEELWKHLRVLLCLTSFLFVLAAFGGSFGEMLASFKALRVGNTGGGLETSNIFIALGFAVDALPWVLDVITIFYALRLLDGVRLDRYSEETTLAAKALARWCVRALCAVTLSVVAYNLLQLVFSKTLRDASFNVTLPLTSICFVLAALLLARMINENRELKADNDLFI